MKEIFIERQKQLLRIAIRKNEILQECFIEEETEEPIPGQIYKGIVKNIVPAIKCAFVDVGHKKNCYMYLDNKFKNTKVKKGQEIIVQVVKEDLGGKGAKVTNAIDIAGRYSVVTLLDKTLNISKKIKDEAFIEEIKNTINKPENLGIMIRTNATEIAVEKINEEIQQLSSIYEALVKKATYSIKPGILFDDGGALQRVLRDNLDEETSKIVLNHQEDFDYVKQYIHSKTELKPSVELHKESRSLLDYYGIEKEILSLRNNKVALNCGGNIVIDKTEAMYVIDINSGKNIKGNSIAKTSFSTNLQAAEEIGRQIRLRNLSGIIVIDFIDMDNEENKQAVIKALNNAFVGDKSKVVIYPFTALNLVQIARRRRGKSIYEYIEEGCKCCKGKGKRIKLSYIKYLLRNEIAKINCEQENDNIKLPDVYIELDEIYKTEVMSDTIAFVTDIDALDKKIYVNFVNNMESYKIEPLIFANQIRNLQIFKIYG